ncbi:MAG: SUMF1/EgtB/PvdO family nonheme iron enzyme [Prevotella sp.]|nr:SUMF1/EgtB/PvdO family nonheme iron enzyme [Prevotella sp.]MBR0527790.1 SUMF1/EgtB/PvdO family nonheme iron enzyme [Prevotella sp.]
MKRMKLWALVATIIISAATLTSCNKDNSTNNQWGAETLTFKVKNSSVEFIMKKVEGGNYSMKYMYENQETTVTGTLSDFYICPVEVTNKLWDAVMGWRPEGQLNNGNAYPVSNVNYYDIVKEGGFIDMLNTLCADQLPAGKRFALPSEAQWEYAARGGQKSMGYLYSGSNTLDEVAWYADNSDGTTHPVGLKQPNELGLYDMTGNVWEWTRDNFVYFDKLKLNQGFNYVCNADNNYRVTRGGSYGTKQTGLETAYHTWLGMHQSYPNRGLRLVLVDEFNEENLVEPTRPDNVLTFAVSNGTVGYYLPMVEVKGGNYELVYERDGEQKTVRGTLSDFYMCQTETMNYIWETVMGSKPQGQTESEGLYPVTMINYEDITKSGGFLDKLNTMCADQLPAGMRFALATEAEWHYAANGGRKSHGYIYAGSNTIGDVAWYSNNGGHASHFVASKQPNELGIYDLSGNVWEYCNDWYADLADLPADQGTDYAGPVSGNRIAGCGGCYDSEPYACTNAYHGREIEHNGRNATLGFRIVLRHIN